MSLSLKAELETWVSALKAYDEQDFERALQLFSLIADSSKILTNIGLIYATIGEHETAVEHFTAATNLDAYLAIAHFQCGVSNFLLERYDLALLNFEDAYLFLRGNEAINYDQIGLKFKLFSAEILFNKGLAALHLGRAQEGMADMQEASRQKVTDEHDVIEEAIRERGQGYTVFSIPVGVLYRPSENKIKNSKSKDYLGKAKLVAASDFKDAFTEFTGAKRLQQTSDPGNSEGADAIVARRIALERAKTTLQASAGVRPDTAAIFASRRSQSVSTPANVPPPLPSNLSRSNTLGRSNSARSASNTATNTVLPLRVAGVGAGGPRDSEEIGSAVSEVSRTLRTQQSLRRLRDQVVQPPSVPSVPRPLPQVLRPGPPQGAPSVLPAMPPSMQDASGADGQFYESYLDGYVEERASPIPISRPPTAQARPHAPPVQPAPLPYQPPQPREPPPAWTPSAASPARTPSLTSSSSGHGRAPSRAANASVMNGNANLTDADVVAVGPSPGMNDGPHRRKPTRRPTVRRKPAYSEDDDDDGFVNDALETSQIRVKLHYQDDVRGMTVSPTTTWDAFLARVTTKFGTAPNGLGMKFADEDGTKITLRDESDFELAIETARENGRGRSEGKIEVWCVDI